MSATPLVDKRQESFYTTAGDDGPRGKYRNYNEVVDDIGGYASFTALCALKDTALQFFFAYILFSNYISNTFDTTFTSGAALYVLITAAGDEQYISITTAFGEWLANVHTMYKSKENEWSFKNNAVTGFSTLLRVVCIIGGAALALDIVVKQYGAAAVTAATKRYTVENSSTLLTPSTWGLNNIFLYVMFYNFMFVGLWILYKHKINHSSFALKGVGPYTAISVASARMNFPIAMSLLYMCILRVSAGNIGDPIQIQIYAVFQWYVQFTNGVGAVIGGAYTGVAVLIVIYWAIYWMAKNRTKDNGYAPMKAGS